MTLHTLDNVPARATWDIQPNHVINEGSYSNVQRIDRTGDLWTVTLQFPAITDANAAELIALISELSEYDAWIQVPDHGYTFRGNTTGNVTVNGGSQTGKSIDLAGLGANVTAALKRGDRIGLATGQVIVVAADADSDGFGQATVSLTKPLRSSPSNSSHVEYEAPMIVCRPAPGSYGFNQNPASITDGVTLTLIEDITSGVPAPSY